ncbi:MAG TPA: hypothetical protein VGD22_10785 [Sphingobacteriaceae bacterium]
MKTPTLVRDYARLSDANLDFKAQAVIISLTGNAYFPTTVPSLTDFTTVKTDFSTAMNNAVSGDRTAIALKNQAKSVLTEAMRLLAVNIEFLAKGDRAKLVSSGFDLAADGENVPPLAAPADFKITDGLNPGELRFVVKRVPQAVSYVHEYTEDPVTPDSKWISKISTSREHVFTGIRSGVRVVGRTGAIGRKGQEAYSNMLTRVVQ